MAEAPARRTLACGPGFPGYWRWKSERALLAFVIASQDSQVGSSDSHSTKYWSRFFRRLFILNTRILLTCSPLAAITEGLDSSFWAGRGWFSVGDNRLAWNTGWICMVGGRSISNTSAERARRTLKGPIFLASSFWLGLARWTFFAFSQTERGEILFEYSNKDLD